MIKEEGNYLQVEVRLYATLRQQAPSEAVKGIVSITLPEKSTVLELLNYIKIDPVEVHMIMVNGKGSELDTVLHDNDRIGLFPPVGGG
jgi:molybdopterin converting factor small subunit